MSKPNESFNQAVEIVGSPSEMARIAELSPSMVYQIQRGIRPLPAYCCPAIEVATGGRIGRAQLRPAKWEKLWPELAA